jgi:hypothetical protein
LRQRDSDAAELVRPSDFRTLRILVGVTGAGVEKQFNDGIDRRSHVEFEITLVRFCGTTPRQGADRARKQCDVPPDGAGADHAGINNSPPNGFGFAVRTGLVAVRGDAVAIVTANASESPDDLVAYHKKLQEGYECVFGSRFVSGARVVDYPWPKLILNRIANFLIPILFLDQIQRGDPTPSKRTGARLSPDCSRCSPITSI